MVLHGLGSHVLLLQLLGDLVVHILLLVVKPVEFDLGKRVSTFFWTSRLFLSARMRISPSRIDWFLYSSISLVF